MQLQLCSALMGHVLFTILTVIILQIMEPPWKAYNVLRKMDYPYEASTISCSFPHVITFCEGEKKTFKMPNLQSEI